MFELIVSGAESGQHLRQQLAESSELVLGRTSESGIVVSWEPQLSRRHASIVVRDHGARVQKLRSATNAIYFSGEIRDEFIINDGDTFVIGTTVFRLVQCGSNNSPDSDSMLEEIRFDSGQLRNVRFSDAEKRIEVLTHLPEVISGSRTDEEFYLRVVQLLLAGIPRADAVAVVQPTDDDVEVLHWDRRHETQGALRPSTRLVRDAVLSSRRSVLHLWEPDRSTDSVYTAIAGCNWSFCTPCAVSGEPRRGLYVAGHLETSADGTLPGSRSASLQADVRFTELVSETVSALRRLRALERHQAGLRQFFAPPILDALGDNLDTELLEPRECDVTVLFCDLRGFSRQAEHAANDLTGLLSRVSQALGVMTAQILKFGGVTGDFQGDAALGFWGWPFASESAALNACRAALGIRTAFENVSSMEGHPLADFRMGIGIAHGRAVAGKIGTAEQVKVTVFGPVVNLASRLESMTSQLRVPIVMDEPTARLVRERLDESEGRSRRLGRVLPAGMETPVDVSELLPPESQYPLLTAEHIAQYEQAVAHLIAGKWEDAWQCLHRMPAGDRAQDFLAMPIVQHNRQAPPDWDGIIRLNRK